MKKPKKRQPWVRWILIALILFALYHVLSGPNGLLNLRTLQGEERAARKHIDSLAGRKQELEAEKQRLLTDSVYLEKLARQQLGMAKPKEKVYRFVTNARDSGSASAQR